MKIASSILLWILLALGFVAAPASAQTPPLVKLCVQTSPTTCVPVSSTAPFPVTGSGGGPVTSNITQWDSIALGTPTLYGTAPTGQVVIGTNSYVTNLQPNGAATIANSPAVNIASDQNVPVQGVAAAGSAASGNPNRMGCDVTTTQPTLSAGNIAPCQVTTRGNLFSQLFFNNQPITAVATNTQTGNAPETSTNAMAVASRSFLWNSGSSNFDLWTDDPGAGGGVGRVVTFPTNSATGGITPVVSTAAEGSHVLKASAGNFYGIQVTSGASAGLLMIFNATSAPADGAVTPIYCKAVAANSTIEMATNPPAVFSTGITAVFSTGTNCFNKTISNTAFFAGLVK